MPHAIHRACVNRPQTATSSRRVAITPIDASRVTTWVTDQVWICHCSGDLCWTHGNLTPHRFLHGPVFLLPSCLAIFLMPLGLNQLWFDLIYALQHPHLSHILNSGCCLCPISTLFLRKDIVFSNSCARGSCVLHVDKSDVSQHRKEPTWINLTEQFSVPCVLLAQVGLALLFFF